MHHVMRALRGFLLLAAGLVGAAALGLGGLYLYHWQLLDLPAIERAVEAKIARADALRSALEEGGERAAIGLHWRRGMGPNFPRELTRCTLSDVTPPLFFLPAALYYEHPEYPAIGVGPT